MCFVFLYISSLFVVSVCVCEVVFVVACGCICGRVWLYMWLCVVAYVLNTWLCRGCMCGFMCLYEIVYAFVCIVSVVYTVIFGQRKKILEGNQRSVHKTHQ